MLLVPALYPILLFTSLVVRVISRPRSLVGEGFSPVSFLSSAGLSGRLSRPVFAGISVSGKNDEKDDTGAGKITSILETKKLEIGSLDKGTKYH